MPWSTNDPAGQQRACWAKRNAELRSGRCVSWDCVAWNHGEHSGCEPGKTVISHKSGHMYVCKKCASHNYYIRLNKKR